MASEKVELLSCPFCGGTNLQKLTDDGVAWTACRSCGATGPLTNKRDEEDAPDWNTRAAIQVSALRGGFEIVEELGSVVGSLRESALPPGDDTGSATPSGGAE